MSRKYKFRDNSQLYFVSFAMVNWIDVFIRNEYKEVMLDRKIMEQKLDNVHKILFRQDLSAARLIGFTAAQGIMPERRDCLILSCWSEALKRLRLLQRSGRCKDDWHKRTLCASYNACASFGGMKLFEGKVEVGA